MMELQNPMQANMRLKNGKHIMVLFRPNLTRQVAQFNKFWATIVVIELDMTIPEMPTKITKNQLITSETDARLIYDMWNYHINTEEIVKDIIRMGYINVDED